VSSAWIAIVAVAGAVVVLGVVGAGALLFWLSRRSSTVEVTVRETPRAVASTSASLPTIAVASASAPTVEAPSPTTSASVAPKTPPTTTTQPNREVREAGAPTPTYRVDLVLVVQPGAGITFNDARIALASRKPQVQRCVDAHGQTPHLDVQLLMTVGSDGITQGVTPGRVNGFTSCLATALASLAFTLQPGPGTHQLYARIIASKTTQ
jgi:hypothetical protein